MKQQAARHGLGACTVAIERNFYRGPVSIEYTGRKGVLEMLLKRCRDGGGGRKPAHDHRSNNSDQTG